MSTSIGSNKGRIMNLSMAENLAVDEKVKAMQPESSDAQALLGRRGFVSRHGYAVWEQAFLPGNGWKGPLAVCTVQSSDGTPLAQVAFAKKQAGWLHFWALGGYYWPWRGIAMEPDAASETAPDALAQQLTHARGGPMVRMGPIMEADSDTQAFISSLLKRGWRGLRRESGQVFELALPSSVKSLEAQASTSLLKNITYLRRRLEKQVGPLRAVRHQLQSSNAEDLLSRAAFIEEASWVAQQDGEVKLAGAANKKYWSLFVQKPSAFEVVLWMLSCGDKDIAFSLHVENSGTICILANGYDPSWKAFSPGSLLSLDIFHDGVARGRRLVDWGQGDSGYKQRWGARPGAHVADLILFRPGWMGGLAYRAMQAALRDWKAL